MVKTAFPYPATSLWISVVLVRIRHLPAVKRRVRLLSDDHHRLDLSRLVRSFFQKYWTNRLIRRCSVGVRRWAVGVNGRLVQARRCSVGVVGRLVAYIYVRIWFFITVPLCYLGTKVLSIMMIMIKVRKSKERF